MYALLLAIHYPQTTQISGYDTCHLAAYYTERLKFRALYHIGARLQAVPHRREGGTGLQSLLASAAKATAINCPRTARLKPCPDYTDCRTCAIIYVATFRTALV
jgi:hypothetical protein